MKYRTHHTDAEVIKIAEEILSHYNSVFLFLATPEKFYFETCELIKENGGKMNELTWVESEIQERYLGVLREFIHYEK